MTADEKPLFMSPEHVAIMNERLASSPEVAAILSALDRPLALGFELTDGPDGKTVHWLLDLGETARFSLEPSPTADVTMRGDWTAMIQQTIGQQPRSEITPTGELDVLPRIMELLDQIRPYGAVPVEIPALPAPEPD